MITRIEKKFVAHTNCGDEISVKLEPQGFIIERKGDVNMEGKITLTPQELIALVGQCKEIYHNAVWMDGNNIDEVSCEG